MRSLTFLLSLLSRELIAMCVGRKRGHLHQINSCVDERSLWHLWACVAYLHHILTCQSLPMESDVTKDEWWWTFGIWKDIFETVKWAPLSLSFSTRICVSWYSSEWARWAESDETTVAFKCSMKRVANLFGATMHFCFWLSQWYFKPHNWNCDPRTTYPLAFS